jgi:3',5'-cyclic-AMP phosphodiesterase
MPVTLPPLTRRRFFKTALAAGAVAGLGRSGLTAEASIDPNRVALLADTHISGNREIVVRGAHLATHLQKVVGELTSGSERPENAVIAGDCALLDGQSGDYDMLGNLIAPARKAGTAVHLALGNHDHRERALNAIPLAVAPDGTPADRRISVVDTPLANWFLLDSLDVVNKTPGKLGNAQLTWLDAALGGKADKPAIVVIHHNPSTGKKSSCLIDTEALFKILGKHRHVKAYAYGHTHNWGVADGPDGLHLVNLPPVAYVFGKGRPNGWVDARVVQDGMSLELRCLDRKHPQHGKTVGLKWRAG